MKTKPIAQELFKITTEINDEKERHQNAIRLLEEKKKKILMEMRDEYEINIIKK